MIRRSYLFVPGNRPERFEKAWQSGADVVILDLEDAVQSAHKDLARQAVAAWLKPERPVYVRINGTSTPWFERDLEVAGQPRRLGGLPPQAGQPAQVAHDPGVLFGGTPVLPSLHA